jgi:hypothetical protein
MLSSKRRAPTALLEDMKTNDFLITRLDTSGSDNSDGPTRLFPPSTSFSTGCRVGSSIRSGCDGAGRAVVRPGLLGGLPGGLVEWITLAMFGAFAYAVGFMIPLVVTYLVETGNRLLMALLVAGGGAVFGAMSLPLPL